MFIEGYTDQLSVEPGDEIGLCVSTNARAYSIEVARVGAERQVVWTQENLPGVEHPVPDNAFSHGCGWPVALKVPVPEDCQSGYYSVMLRGSDGERKSEGEMSFVVRSAHPGRDTRILLQLTTNTDNAYNTWGGASLYRGPDGPARRVSFDRPFSGFEGAEGLLMFSIGVEWESELRAGTLSASLHEEIRSQVLLQAVPGIALSQRATLNVEEPGKEWTLTDFFGAGPAEQTVKKEGDRLKFYNNMTSWGSGWHHWERPFVVWAERAGYRLDYAVSSDLEFHPEILQHYRLVLSVGHDEYWSSPMRDHLEAFVAAGGNVAFFSGNTAYWQVRSEDKGRALVGWKDAYKQDPVYGSGDHRLLTTLWCSRLINRPENQLTGVSFAYGGYHRYFDQFPDGAGAYTIHRPEHWIFAGTGLERGDLLGAQGKIVFYECDGCEFEQEDGLPVPTHRDGTPDTFEILGTTPAGLTRFDGSIDFVSEAVYGEGSDKKLPYPGAAVLGIYTRGGTVITCGCTDWVNGLRGKDEAVERTTSNILDRLSK